MRLRILTVPTSIIDGVPLDQVTSGTIYELRCGVAAVLLAEGCAEVVAEAGAEPVHPPPPPFVHIKPRVLVVDDNPDFRRLTELCLIRQGYRVVGAGDGREAIERLREECPDLIVLDLNMPVMNGWEFRTEQRYFTDEPRASVPVLLVTAASDAAAHAETLGAVGVLSKPFRVDDLLEAVSTAIGSPGSSPDGLGAARPRGRAARRPRTKG